MDGDPHLGQRHCHAGRPLIAHGRRGIDSAPIEERDAWFTRSSTGIPSPGPSHISSPYHSGDILWQTEEDSAQSRITVQDTDGEIEALIMDRIDQINIEDDPAQRVALAELPLGISTSTGFDPTLNLARIDQWSYAYRAVERPGSGSAKRSGQINRLPPTGASRSCI